MSPDRDPAARFAQRGRPYWLLGSAVMLLTATALLVLAPVLVSFSWWWASVAAIIVTGVSSALLRGWNVAPPLVPLLSFCALLVYLTFGFGAGTGLLLLLPTPDTIGVFGALIAEGQSSIQTQAVPAEATPGIVFLLSIGAGLLVLLADTLAVWARMPALAGIPVAVLAIVPTVALRQDEQLWVLVLVASAYLLLLRVDVRTRRGEEQAATGSNDRMPGGPRIVAATKQPGLGPLGGAIGVGSVAIVSALVLTAAVPVVSLGAPLGVGPPSTSLFGGAVNPLIDLGQDLRRPAPAPALSYSSTSSRAVYLKMLTLDSFSGDSWVAGHSAFNESNTVDKFGAPPGLGENVATKEVRTSIQVAAVRSEWLPVPYPATSIEGLNGQWYWDSDALTVATTHSTIAGQNYVVNGLELLPTQQDLAASEKQYPGEIARYLELPGDIPPLIGETARAVTATAETPYLQAAALQKFLRGRDFIYSEETPVDEGFDGGGLRAIASFLEVRSGYCIHFASAMAVMARTLDIPSRVALGYAPGERTRQRLEGAVLYQVQTSDLHAWPELYFEGVGWVPFEPTPGRGSVPGYSLPTAAVTAPIVPAPQASSGAVNGPDARNVDESNQPSAVADAEEARALLTRNLLLAAAVLALLAVPWFSRSLLAAWRRRRTAAGAGIGPLWQELADTLTDCGHPVSDTETPRARGGAIRTILRDAGGESAEADAALQRLLDEFERERYARPRDGDGPRGDASAMLRDAALLDAAIRGAVPPRRRLRARLIPASLFARVGAAFAPGQGVLSNTR
ncbi:transglutaminase-like putative cysteine protease [Microterricola gilva]|uniref:Transglutaminase-like putative cysteine protease n=1 Tax=Microterricola gilva TaxID=393267 RepID=A0A4Q8AL20_9MICO|nr:DUF3488 and transglutaminase-like domain-containing protein [Microterricola gilva]RZU64741.1 transglutaminase-like putative cysteine protease [Microterricola gilva]